MISGQKKIGQYTILGDLGVGGMGSVRLARSPSGRMVVVKCALHSEPDLEQRLVDEANVGFRLNHPHIVETIDLFHDDKHPVLVVAYVSGGSLFELRRHHPLPVPVVARIGRQVAAALHAIHTATTAEGKPLAVVHRDVTPANIMVGHDGDARLIDLGIARSTESSASKTATGFLRGTLRYLAPELFGETRHSPATDLWSLGLCILEAALGRRAILGGDAEAVGKIVAWSGIRLLPNERLDPRLHDILHVLLQRDPDKRVCDAALAAQMFERLEAQFAGTQQAAKNVVSAAIGPPKGVPTVDEEATELFVREAASTFCGASSPFSDLATASVPSTEAMADFALTSARTAPALGDLYRANASHANRNAVASESVSATTCSSGSEADSRAKVATPSRVPANDDAQKQALEQPTGFTDSIDTVLLINDDDVIGFADDVTGAPPIPETPSDALARWPDFNGPAALEPPPGSAQMANQIAQTGKDAGGDDPFACGIVEGQLLTPSKPVPIAASGETLPAAPKNPRAMMARDCGFPEPPPTPADSLKDYIEAIRGLEAFEKGSDQ